MIAERDAVDEQDYTDPALDIPVDEDADEWDGDDETLSCGCCRCCGCSCPDPEYEDYPYYCCEDCG